MKFSEKIKVSNEFEKIEYIDELILKLQLLYSQSVVDDAFFDKALYLLKQEKSELAHTIDEIELEKIKKVKKFDEMSYEERKKYIEIQKQGIKMRLLEANNFSELNILYDRISNQLEEDEIYELQDVLKHEFTKNFEKIFKNSYIYYLKNSYTKNYGILDIYDLIMVDGKLKSRNNNFDFTINEELFKNQRIKKFDCSELEALKKIIKNTYYCFTDKFIEGELKRIIKIPPKQINLKDRIRQIKDTIRIILNKDENRFFRTTLTIESDFKFKEKLNQCKKIYKIELKSEIPLVIFDNTIFKTCESGFIITERGFYLKNEDLNFINIDEIDDIQLVLDSLYIQKNKLLCDIITCDHREEFKDAVILITYLIQNGKDTSKDIDITINEVLDV